MLSLTSTRKSGAGGLGAWLFWSAATAPGFSVILMWEAWAEPPEAKVHALSLVLLVIALGEGLLLPTSLQLATAALSTHRRAARFRRRSSVLRSRRQWSASGLGGGDRGWPHTEFFALHALITLGAGVRGRDR